ncbi:MAG: alkaline phosphatase family protein [Candidatus Cloacimonetes bacterium]|nr:alkaline phosphatase family protein [Candidatus Cloacimonadota bacterium]
MYIPNYKNGSIVNLMSSITSACGDNPIYKPIQSLNPSELSKSSNIVLIIIDGLGYEYLTTHGKNTILMEHLKDKLTSVFPSTTASGITSFLTGVSTQQHAITGWFVYLKELGLVSTILPFNPRCGGLPFGKIDIKPEVIFSQKTVFEKINRKSYHITNRRYVNSDYTTAYCKGAKRLSYKNLSNFFKRIKKAIKSKYDKKFICAYWPCFDALCHEYGTKSNEVSNHFTELNERITSLLKSIENKNTTVIITADHGLIDTNKSKIVHLKNHPKLLDALALPLSGDPRVAYCYVRPSKTKQFEDYIDQNFKDICDLYKSEDLVKRNFFGLFEPNKKLFDRIGDYTLIMKENYIIKDFVLGEEEKYLIGHHGGVSKEEMFVPLIVFET